MDCNIVYNGKKYTDDEFLAYLKDRGVGADIIVREQSLINRAAELAPGNVRGFYKDVFLKDPRTALQEAAQQANSSPSEKRGAIKTFGREIISIAQELFPNAKSGSPYIQISSTEPKPFSPKVIGKFKEFVDRIGATILEKPAIIVNGKKLNANGIAYASKGLIEIVNGKMDVALPEEAMHIAVELIQQQNPTLFKALLSDVNNHPESSQVFNLYGNNKLYQTPDGKPDVVKLKKEAAAKILARVAAGITDETTNKEAFAKTRSLWQRILDWLKQLFTKARFNPFEEAAEQVVGKKTTEFKGSVNDLRANKAEFLQKNREAVDYQFKGIKKLSDNIDKVQKWEKQIKDKDIFFKKLQTDLQMPKDQLSLLQERYHGDIVEAMTSMAADMSYTVEVKPGSEGELIALDEQGEPYQRTGGKLYQHLTVPGGTNYEENDIRTPEIIPSIHSHAEFATDNSIGWFRSDSLVSGGKYYKGGFFEGERISSETIGGTPLNVRRILELQSDLFQKGREKEDLINEPSITYRNGFKEYVSGVGSLKDNQFLQLLNKEGNWIGFFIKTIMQDSLNKVYKSVRFPAGDTASKVEGHEVIADRITAIDKAIEGYKNRPFPFKVGSTMDVNEGSDIPEGMNDEVISETNEEGMIEAFIPITESNIDKVRAVFELQRAAEIESLEKEKQRYKTEGIGKLAPIYSFYEVRLKNTLEKTYGKLNVTRVTDEHGNDWFEVGVDPSRDSEIFLQLNEEETWDKIDKVAQTVAQKGHGFLVNGKQVAHTVEGRVDASIKKRARDYAEYYVMRDEFRKEYESKVQNEFSHIASRYIDDNGTLRTDYNESPLTSVIDPYDLSFVNTLDKWFRKKLESYDEGTRFIVNKPIYNSASDTAGMASFIAITPEGKVDINQFKLLTTTPKALDISKNLQNAYSVEVEAIKDILKTGYGIDESDFRETTAVPIKASTRREADGKFVLTGLKIGKVDAKLEKDFTLLPVPAASQSTGNKKLDELVSQFKAFLKQLNSQQAPVGEENVKARRVAELMMAIRELQIHKSADRLLETAQEIANDEESKFEGFKKKVEATDAIAVGEPGLNEILKQIHISTSRLAPYASLGETMRVVYGKNDKEGFHKQGKEISSTTEELLRDLDRLEDFVYTDLFSKITNINDELKPEKKIPFWRKWFLGPSHGSMKAQGQFFHLIERTDNFYRLEYGKLINEIKDINRELADAKITNDDLTKMVLEHDAEDNWTGNTIQKVDKSFYSTVSKALNKKDLKTVRASIDIDAYKEWYNRRYEELKEASKLNNPGNTPEESEQMRKDFLDEWEAAYNIDKKSAATPANARVYAFPKPGSWISPEYAAIEKIPSVLKLYNLLGKLIDRADKSGMFQDYRQKYGFFPNISKSFVEKASTKDGFKDGYLNPWKGLETVPDDALLGETDPISHESINRVRGHYVRDLGKRVQNTDGTYFSDYAGVSQQVVKAIGLFASDVVRFELKIETEEIAKAIVNIEGRRPTLRGTKSKQTGEQQKAPNIENLDTMIKYLNFYYYDQTIQNADATIKVNVGKFARGFNKFVGHTAMMVPEHDEVTLSLNKFVALTGRWFNTKTMAFSTLGPIANLFGGESNAYINAGDDFSRMDLTRAMLKIADTQSWGSPEGRLRLALIHFFKPELNSEERVDARRLSAYKAERVLTTDHLFIGMRKTDEAVNMTTSVAYFENTVLIDGKLQNIVHLVREKNNWNGRYDLPGGEPARKELEKKVATEIEEMKTNSPNTLMKVAKLNKEGHLVLDISREEYKTYRQALVQMNKKMLGNMSADDLALYRTSSFFAQAMMFKNWIPELTYTRLGPLEYNYGTKKYGYGRTRGFVGHVAHYGLSAVGDILKTLGGSKKSLIDHAAEEYEKRRQRAADKGEDFNLNKGEFTDIYTKAVMSGFKEVGLALGLLGMYFALKAYAQTDKEKDHVKQGALKFTLRAIDKLQDEISFFYNPTSFTSLFNGNIFPAISLATDAQKLILHAYRLSVAEIEGDEKGIKNAHPMKYIYKDIPILKEWVNYQAMFSAQFAKDNGIVLQSQSGGGR